MRLTKDYGRRLADLQERSVRLRAAAKPWKAGLLQLYPHLEERDIAGVHAGRDFDSHRLTELASASSLSPDIVAWLAHLYVRPDFHDYAAWHRRLRAAYSSFRGPDDELKAFFTEESATGKFFLLHGQLQVWDEFSGETTGIHIEQNDDEDLFPLAVSGYLVERGLAFETSVDVLEVAFGDGWAEWKSFWRHF